MFKRKELGGFELFFGLAIVLFVVLMALFFASFFVAIVWHALQTLWVFASAIVWVASW